MSFQDLSITGSPTPRAVSRSAVSSRRQNNVTAKNASAAREQGGAIITKEKLALAKKLAYYQTEVNQAKKVSILQPKEKVNDVNVAKTQVPPLKLNLLKRPDSGGYHVTPGLESSRSVMSWGDNSYRASRPAGKLEIKERNKDDSQIHKAEDFKGEHYQDKCTNRENQLEEDPGGEYDEFAGQVLGFHEYETEEEGVKRRRKFETVLSHMIQDQTQPETASEHTLTTPWATSERSEQRSHSEGRHSQGSHSERADFYALKEIPRLKRLDNVLHATSKELTFDHLQKRGTEDRLSFKVRIINRCARDSLRDLYAFYFISDGSVAVYEYKEMGKRHSATPLFPRAVYYHPSGQWMGSPYTLPDLKIGSSLLFPTSNNAVLPQTVTRAPYVLLRVADISQEEVIDLVHDGCRIEERAEREEGLKNYITPEEISRNRNLEIIQNQIKEQLKSRPIRALVGLGHYFLLHDKDKDGFWRADELQAVLRTFRITLSHHDFELFWRLLDVDGSGMLDVGEFLRGMLGEMSEARSGLVSRAWLRMDAAKSGEASFITVRQFYNPAISLDPRADNSASKEELVEEFLECFSAGPLNQKITYCEFVDYYTAISLSAPSDEVFTALMKHCWNI